MPWAAAVSAVLHGVALAAVLLLQRPDRTAAPAGEGVALIWQEQSGEAPGPPAPPPAVPSPEEQMAATAPPPPAEAPAVPPQDPPPEEPQQPAEALLLLPPPPPPPPAEASAVPPHDPPPPEEPQQPTEALPLPPAQPPPPPPRAEPQPAPAAPARQAAPAPPPAGNPAAPPLALGGGQVSGPVTPPGLADGIRNSQPEYPFASRMRGEQGVVTVRLHISATGRVEDVEVLRGSGHAALDAAAEQAVRGWRFRPARQDGLPVPGSIRTSIQFRLNQ